MRAAVIRESSTPAGIGQWASIQSVAPSFGVEVSSVSVSNDKDDKEIERTIMAVVPGSNGGLIVAASPLTLIRRSLFIKLAARRELPAVYWDRSFVTSGGLISPMWSINFGARPAMSIAFSRAKRLLVCQCKRRTNMSWSSTSKPRRHSGSPCRSRCLPAPTR